MASANGPFSIAGPLGLHTRCLRSLSFFVCRRFVQWSRRVIRLTSLSSLPTSLMRTDSATVNRRVELTARPYLWDVGCATSTDATHCLFLTAVLTSPIRDGRMAAIHARCSDSVTEPVPARVAACLALHGCCPCCITSPPLSPPFTPFGRTASRRLGHRSSRLHHRRSPNTDSSSSRTSPHSSYREHTPGVAAAIVCRAD
jgi:hypothetical protein